MEWSLGEAHVDAGEAAHEAPREPARARWSRDVVLVRLAQCGSRLAFDLLWLRHAAAVHAVLSALVPPHDVDDLVQETAVHAWRRARTLREVERFPQWACAIARNLGRDRLNRLGARGAVSLDDVQEPAHDDGREQRLTADEVLARVRELPSCYAEPLLLRLLAGLDAEEIAARTGLTPGSVRVNLHRGMRRLRDALGAEAEA
ncbi:MAG: sigma-70 family RNA polymerase sigma factor [Planctomycetes bacterium]|nr:sigma-70 family RNA polymerase sigma factor [Planctomycetota bacterium]